MNSYSIILPFINEINSLEKTIKVIKSDNQTSELEFLVIISKKLTTENDYNNLIKLSSRLIDCKLDIFYQDKPFVGGAIKKGIEKSAKSHIIIMASDLETNPSDLKKMIKLSEDYQNDIICADRWKEKQNISFKGYGFFKKNFNLIFQYLTSKLYNCEFIDFTFAYRIYPKKALKEFEFKELRHSFALEMILKPLKAGYNLRSAHTTWSSRTEGRSNNSIINYLHYFKTLVAVRFF